MAEHNELGKKGEDIACDYLRKAGYLILDRGWTWLKSEIDIIAYFNGRLVIVEVKTRSSLEYADPDDTIGRKKLLQIYDATDRYMMVKNITWEVQYDLITVIDHGHTWTIDHIEEAFYPFMTR